jgi:hypothetical protein
LTDTVNEVKKQCKIDKKYAGGCDNKKIIKMELYKNLRLKAMK